MWRWRDQPRADRTGRAVRSRTGAGTDRSRRLEVEALEARRLLSVGIREYPIPTANSAPFWITAGPSSSLYFTAGGANQIGAYDPATHGFTSFFIPTVTIGSSSYITTGNDGSLYFTVSQDNAIGQLNPGTHVVTTFPIPTAGLGPQFITTAPDGDLYFTATGANVIEQLDPTSRVFTTFFIPTANAGASGITYGPDNSLWFIESAANKIGQLNPVTNVFTELPIPTTIGGTSTITAGTDGDLYFTEPGSNSIGQFNPTTRAFRSLPIPAPNSEPATITTGADGDLFFTHAGTNQIGQLNPATLQFTELLIPTANSGVTGITAGPGGNVYFTETDANKIGEVVISTPTPPTPPPAKKQKGVVVIRPKIFTTTQLTVAPNPSIVGQVVTLTATVSIAEAATPTGTVTFFIDGKAQPPVPLAGQNGVAQATLSTKLADATHIITATYKGNSTFAASMSNAVSLVVAPALGDGPTVVRLARSGFHSLPTTLVLTFDKALDMATAQDPLNYTITNSQGHSIRIASVVYNASALSVTITPGARLNLHRPYLLTVIGAAPTGVTDTSGNLLDGALTGEPGSNYMATVTALDLVIPANKKTRLGGRVRG
jgi:streptogramin lyase